MIRTVPETGSTNADLLEAAANGAPDGLWLRAERQSGGRGRMGRAWSSPPGNLYASHLVRLQPGDPPAPSLAFVAAVAVHRTLSANAPAIPFLIKWPNDVLVNGAKISGILLEREGDAVVIGIGVNLAHHPEDLLRPVTSLAALTGESHAPAMFMDGLAEVMTIALAQWRSEGMGAVLDHWRAAAHPAGTPLSIYLPDGERLAGRFDGLDNQGGLLLRLDDGAIRAIHAGDVFLV